jgi:hypothetical protein
MEFFKDARYKVPNHDLFKSPVTYAPFSSLSNLLIVSQDTFIHYQNWKLYSGCCLLSLYILRKVKNLCRFICHTLKRRLPYGVAAPVDTRLLRQEDSDGAKRSERRKKGRGNLGGGGGGDKGSRGSEHRFSIFFIWFSLSSLTALVSWNAPLRTGNSLILGGSALRRRFVPESRFCVYFHQLDSSCIRLCEMYGMRTHYTNAPHTVLRRAGEQMTVPSRNVTKRSCLWTTVFCFLPYHQRVAINFSHRSILFLICDHILPR